MNPDTKPGDRQGVEQTVKVSLGERATWWSVFGLSLPAAIFLGWLSWHLLEKQALKLKPDPVGYCMRGMRSLWTVLLA